MLASPFDEELFYWLQKFLPRGLRETAWKCMQRATDLFAQDCHFDVVDCITDLLQECTAATAQLHSLSPIVVVPTDDVDSASTPTPSALGIAIFMSFLRESRLYQVSSGKVCACRQLLADIHDMDNWRVVRGAGGDGCGTYYRFDEKTQAHLFKVVGVIPNRLPDVIGVLMELDLYTEWFPFCFCATLQGEVTRFHKASCFAVRPPWPFRSREVFLEGYGVDDLSANRRVIIVSRSLCEGDALPTEVRRPSPSTHVRLEMKYTGFLVEALNPTHSQVSYIMNVDPKLPYVPSSAVNWVSGKLVWTILKEISKAARSYEDENSLYAERRRQQPDVYEYLERRFCEINKFHFSSEK